MEGTLAQQPPKYGLQALFCVIRHLALEDTPGTWTLSFPFVHRV